MIFNQTLDTSCAYKVTEYPGVAWHVLGYVEHDTEDTIWDGIREVDESMVRAVMVGDDRVFEIDIDDIEPLNDNDYCPGCGQIGCCAYDC